MFSRRIGDVLVGHGYMDEAGRERALAHAEWSGSTFGRACVELGLVTKSTLWQALALQTGGNPVQLDNLDIDPAILTLLPAAIALKHRCVPVGVRTDIGRGMLLLAVDGPRSSKALEEITFAAGRRVMLLVAPEDALDRTLERCYAPRTFEFARR